MGRRLLKMYIRNSDGVFVAVEGLEYDEFLIWVDRSVYTYTSTNILDDDFILLKKVNK